MTKKLLPLDGGEYTPEQQRVANYISDLTGIGGGNDPIGFLMASHTILVYDRRWKPFDTAPTDGTEVIFWVSSEKGFQDCTAIFYYISEEQSKTFNAIYPKSGWYWSDSQEPLKRPDLIRGWKEYPQAPKQFSTKEDKVK